jgi:acetyl esterase
MLKSATTYTYLETEQGPVQAHFFVPEDFKPTDRRPMVVFFHGGFWDNPMATQFVPHCLHFASRGAVAVAVETRVFSVHRTGAVEALADAKLFFDWLGEHYVHFGIDPKRITVGGAAGGALLALSLVLPKLKKGETPHVLAPSGLVLFSTLVDPTERTAFERFPNIKVAKELSPLRNARRKLPPMILFHGKNDRLTPFEPVRKFLKSMRWRRNKIELQEYENVEHSFFNFNVSELHYELTLNAADAFMVQNGLLDPAPVSAEV